MKPEEADIPFFVEKLRDGLTHRQAKNKAYSLRAYAKHLGIPASTLSQVMIGNRALPLKNADAVMVNLKLSPKDRSRFLDSLYQVDCALDAIKIRPKNDRVFLDETYSEIISEWEHYAAIMLYDCVERLDLETVMERLGLKRARAEVVIENLLRYQMMKREPDGQLMVKPTSYKTSEDVASSALRDSHVEALSLAKEKLDDVPSDLRDFSSLTVAVDLKQLPIAKKIIREFRQKMTELLKTGDKTEVYQLAIQFYPLSRASAKAKK
jgi:uncharacterized protein (TIGR02147 family)